MMLHFSKEECKLLDINETSVVTFDTIFNDDKDGGASINISFHKKKRFNPFDKIKSLFK